LKKKEMPGMKMLAGTSPGEGQLTFEEFRIQVIDDYRLATISRETSLMGRKEVLRGKAKFGIFGDGKELAQIALSRVFKEGDIRSGYYRDQTLAFATGVYGASILFSALCRYQPG